MNNYVRLKHPKKNEKKPDKYTTLNQINIAVQNK